MAGLTAGLPVLLTGLPGHGRGSAGPWSRVCRALDAMLQAVSQAMRPYAITDNYAPIES